MFITHGNPTGSFCNACNASRGDFQANPTTGLELSGGTIAPNGHADLTIASPVVIAVRVPPATPGCANCQVCWRIEQDPAGTGWVDCDGGESWDALITIDQCQGGTNDGQLCVDDTDCPGGGTCVEGGSNGASAPPAAPGLVGNYKLIAYSGDPATYPPGAAVIKARVKTTGTVPTGGCPAPGDAAWATPQDDFSALLVTGQATSRLNTPRRCTGDTFGVVCPALDPYEVNISGANFDCTNWTTTPGPALVTPLNVLDEAFGGNYADGDMAEALRLEVWDGVNQQ